MAEPIRLIILCSGDNFQPIGEVEEAAAKKAINIVADAGGTGNLRSRRQILMLPVEPQTAI